MSSFQKVKFNALPKQLTDNNNPINVTQPSLPDLESFLPYLEEIWRTKTLTNSGPFHNKFESALAEYLGVPYVSLFTNATIALLTALQAQQIQGEVITTPYSFVATSNALLWNGLRPIFVDIDPHTFNISPERIEEAITPETSAILPVHCYGRPCDVNSINSIAKKNNLKVIYDAAHAFGVRLNKRSILNYGDLSILSFHATKVFNTFEGGAIISHDIRTKQKIDQLKNFGYVNELTVVEAGINGKMSEFNSALGLLQLTRIDEVLKKRQRVDETYRNELTGVRGIQFSEIPIQVDFNWSYFPIRVTEKFPTSRDVLYEYLKSKNIMGRRYFYPLISEFPMYRNLRSSNLQKLHHAYQASREIICLPLHAELDIKIAKDIVRCIKELANTTI